MKKMWYDRKCRTKAKKELPKKTQKSFEKDLTNEKRCGIIKKLSGKNGQQKTKGILKIEQPRIRKPLEIL